MTPDAREGREEVGAGLDGGREEPSGAEAGADGGAGHADMEGSSARVDEGVEFAQEVGVKGLFSDWPATTSYYANCFRRK